MRFKKLKYQFGILFLIIFSGIKLNAQYPLLKHFNTSDGLPSSTIYALVQDLDGFVWFATDVGVSRFDGRRFLNFSTSDGLCDNYIISVRIDSKGRVWFLGFNGTVSYWYKSKIYNADNDPLLKNIITSTTFVDMFEDNAKRLWFISQSEYLILENNEIVKPDSSLLISAGFVFNGTDGQYIMVPSKSFIKQQGSSQITRLKLRYNLKMTGAFWRGSDGSILFVSSEGVIKQTDTLQTLLIPLKGDMIKNQQPGMVLTSDSLLWISTIGKGVYCYDLRNPFAEPFVFLKEKMAGGMMLDREGNIWIGTLNEGVYMIPEWGRRVNVYNKDNGLPDDHCFEIHTLPTGEVIVGMNNGSVALISQKQITKFQIPPSESQPNKVHHILETKDALWIASDKGIIHRNFKTGCNHFLLYNADSKADIRKIGSIKDITHDDKNVYFISGFNIFSYPLNCDGKSIYPHHPVNERPTRTYSIYYDKNGELWFATKSGLQSKKGGRFLDHAKEDARLAKGINAIAETEDSILVLATYGYGVLFYKNGKILHNITVADGLESDICRRVFVFKNQIYVSTPSGVSVIYYKKGKILQVVNVNTGNFLPSNDVNDVFANDSNIFVATSEGAAIIGHWAIDKIKPDIPLLYLTEVRVNDTVVSTDKSYVFSYKQNAFKFGFVGIYFQLPKGVVYRYKIKDNQDWQYTRNNSVDFSYLVPGVYRFQLEARIANGDWCGLKTFSFVINPPFWLEPWFVLLVMVVVVAFIYIAIRFRLKILKQRKEEKTKLEKQITQLEQQALQTLMNPHFIFNVMNSIQHFINVSDKMAANRYLADFAKLIRFNLTISLKRFISLEEEVNYLLLYLSFEKLRFGDNLTYEINIDPEIDISETTIAVMMIQPFIENAIWHGILPMNAKGHIYINIQKATNDLLKIIIEDDGVGIKEAYLLDHAFEALKENHAMSMTLQRLYLLGKSSGHDLYIRYRHMHPNKKNKGTIAEITLPANL